MGTLIFFFFFQAEDGIRYFHVTGGQTCALPIALSGAPRDFLELDSNAAVKVVVAGGTGVAILSTLAVASELADGRLVEVPTTGLDLRRSLRAVWPKGRRL